MAAVKRLIDAARKGGILVDMTFHRAIDMARDMVEGVRVVKELGFRRILTSGGEATAVRGATTIKKIVKEFGDDLIVMPGGGISVSNLEDILATTGAKEFHASARAKKESLMQFRNESCSMGSNSEEFTILVTSEEKVRQLVDIHNSQTK